MLIKEYIPFYKRNLVIAIPVILSQAGQVSVQIVDNIMVGHLGTVQFAAASFAGTVVICGIVFGMGFSFGLTPLVGEAFGRGKHREAAGLFKHSVLTNLILSIALASLMFLLTFFMKYMGQPPEVVRLAVPFYQWLVASIIPFLIFFSFKQFAEGIGNTKVAMFITIGINILNIILNYLLIYGKFGLPALGINGSCIATFISRLCMPVAMLIFFFKKRSFNRYFYFFKQTKFQIQTIMRLFSIGLPIGVQMVMEVAAFSLGSIMMGWFGDIYIAAHQIVLTLSTLTYMISNGIASGTMIRVSHQLGAKRYKDMRYAANASFHMALVFMSLAAIIFIFFRSWLPMIFTSDPLVISSASILLIVAGFFQVFDGMQTVALGALRGISDVKIPMYCSFVSYILLALPVGYFCAVTIHLGPIGVWIGFLFGLFFAAVTFFLRFNKLSKVIIKTQGVGRYES